MAQLENASRHLTAGQWSDAVEAIRRVQETEPSKLVKVDFIRPVAGFERYVTAADYCQWRLAALGARAPEALAQYRRLVDALAENWLREGQQKNDEALLKRVVEEAFASRSGDDALLKLGDLALARDDIAGARAAWRRIGIKSIGARSAGVGEFPDSNIDPASIQARLVLASILEGSGQLATSELQQFRQAYPVASGSLAGRSGRYGDLLQALLDESRAWPSKKQSKDWLTFAGEPSRNKIANLDVEIGAKPLWSYRLPRAGDLSYFPVVVDNRAFVTFDASGQSHVVSLDLKTGEPVWQSQHSRGMLPSSTLPPSTLPSSTPDESDAYANLPRRLGIARYTANAADGKLFARLGSPVTVPTSHRAATWLAKDQGFLMGFDLTAQSKPLEGFPIRPPSNEWSFERTPLYDDGLMFVAMRRVSGAGSQLFAAAYDLQTTPVAQADEPMDRPVGQLRWRTRICSAVNAGGGDIDQITHLLLTKNHNRIYFNTSSGCVAAVDASDGKLLWVVKYPRTYADDRDLAPCLTWNDLVIVAPADGDRLFALEAVTGELAWTTETGAMADVVHLLGVTDDTLAVSGDSLYFVDASTGRLIARYPPKAQGEVPVGMGRGIVAGNRIWWPTQNSILVLEARPVQTERGWEPRLMREIPLEPHGLKGGNLVIAHGVLLVAGHDKLVAFGK